MKTTALCLPLVAALIVGLAAPASAADNTWLPNLNPFASKPKAPTSARVSDSSSWHFPKLLPGSAPAKRRPAQPSMWQKMTSGTKSAWSKTTSAVNPWDHKKTAAAAKPAPAVSGSNSLFSQATKKPAATKESSPVQPASWFSTEKREEPKSVNEFLAHPRPQ
jgi:hypothetical protein